MPRQGGRPAAQPAQEHDPAHCRARLQQLPPARARAAAAILASAVGDAAARPLHWIYNREELRTLLETRVTLAVV